MLCQLCHGMLYRHQGRKGSVSNLKQEFWHQESKENLSDTAEKSGCYICRVLNAKVVRFPWKPQRTTGESNSDKERLLSASLKSFPKRRGLYRLDFKIHGINEIVASFVLKEDASENSDGSAILPASTHTSDAVVFEMAQKWIKDCEDDHAECRNASFSAVEYHPTRLLCIEPTEPNPKIRLVSQNKVEKMFEQPAMTGRYVTLSHCWGKKPFTKLTSQTLQGFLSGIPWKDLPPTFQDAITFTAKFGVQWIWIDALCILQGNDEASEKDWLVEAARMNEVYKNAYFNISATASRDSSEGMYRKRDNTIAWVDKVTLNTKDLLSGPSIGASPQEVKGRQQLRRCTIFDLSFWDTCVDTAPVNRRSWVFQERLLAPRVIHFCEDQIAFECRNSDRAESRPDGLPHYHMQRNELVDGARLKSFDVRTGRQLRLARLSNKHSSRIILEGKTDPETPEAKRMYFYELWKRIVDAYTKMELTEEKDRLIALAGIAREMATEMEGHGLKDRYIAGMWEQSIANHLLWYSNEGVGATRQPYQNNRPKDKNGSPIYRAPTFSWGSVESSRGVSFPEPTNAKSLIRVNVVRLIYRRGEDMYGLLTDGYIVIKGVLRRIELSDVKAPLATPIMTRKFNVRAPSKEDENRSHPRPYQRTTYFISLGISVHFTAKLAFAIVMCTMGLLSVSIMSTTKTYGFLLRNWIAATVLLAICGTLTIGTLYLALYNADSISNADETTNRYSWRVVSDGEPTGPRYETVYLDSPASQPSIFGPNGKVFCIPALEDEDYLSCLLVQATDESDYGVRYRRVGLAKIRKLYGNVEDILNITTAPGQNEIDDGKYYWNPKLDKARKADREDTREKRDGESMICII